MRHQSTYSDPEKNRLTDRHSVSPSGSVFGVRYVSPRAPTPRSLSRPYQPGYSDGAPATVGKYPPAMGNRADGSGRIKYRPNEDWPASRETSPDNQTNRSGRKNYRPSEDWPESLQSSQRFNRKGRENRDSSQEKNENWGRSREHLPDLSKRVSRSGRKRYRPNEDSPGGHETSQGSNKEWRENRANSREKSEEGQEHLPDAYNNWSASRATSRPDSTGSNTQRSRAVSKSSGMYGGEAAAAEW